MKVPNWWTLSEQSSEPWTASLARACAYNKPAPPESTPPLEKPPPPSLTGFYVAKTAAIPVHPAPHKVSWEEPSRELRRNEVVEVVSIKGSWVELAPVHQRWAKRTIDPAIATPAQLGMLQQCVMDRPSGCLVAPADPHWAEVKHAITVHFGPSSSSPVAATVHSGQLVQLKHINAHGSWPVERKRWVQLVPGKGALHSVLCEAGVELWAPIQAPQSAENSRDPLARPKERWWLVEAAPHWYEVKPQAKEPPQKVPEETIALELITCEVARAQLQLRLDREAKREAVKQRKELLKVLTAAPLDCDSTPSLVTAATDAHLSRKPRLGKQKKQLENSSSRASHEGMRCIKLYKEPGVTAADKEVGRLFVGQLCRVDGWDSRGEYFQLVHNEWVMATRSAHTAFGDGFERSAAANNQLLRPFVFPQDLNLLAPQNEHLNRRVRNHYEKRQQPTSARHNGTTSVQHPQSSKRVLKSKIPLLMGSLTSCSVHEVMAAAALSTVRLTGKLDPQEPVSRDVFNRVLQGTRFCDFAKWYDEQLEWDDGDEGTVDTLGLITAAKTWCTNTQSSPLRAPPEMCAADDSVLFPARAPFADGEADASLEQTFDRFSRKQLVIRESDTGSEEMQEIELMAAHDFVRLNREFELIPKVVTEEKAMQLFENAVCSENRGCLDWVDFESILWKLLDLAACSVRAHEEPSNVKFLPAKIRQLRRIIHSHAEFKE